MLLQKVLKYQPKKKFKINAKLVIRPNILYFTKIKRITRKKPIIEDLNSMFK